MLLDQRQAREHVSQVEVQLAELEALPDSPARQAAFSAVQALMDLYGAGLARILDLSPELAPRLTEDELLTHLLLLHGLHPVDARTRVESALEEVRPYLATHGGNVELLSVDDGVVRLRLQGSCHGCPSSTATLKQAIEEAIFKNAPDLERVYAEGVEAPPAIVSVESLLQQFKSCPIP